VNPEQEAIGAGVDARSGVEEPGSPCLELRRSPARAALLSAAAPGWGQVYNHHLDHAVIVWIWGFLCAASGLGLLGLGLLGRLIPATWPRPPLGDWIADHPGRTSLAWAGVTACFWFWNVCDAHGRARAINQGRVRVRYTLRRQMVHVLASQLLGMIPFVGIFFPSGVVAEAWDAYRERRRPDATRLLQEGGQALLEWAVTRTAFFAFWAGLVIWAGWWVLRAFGVLP
jgi:hypothetical protein